MNSEKYNQIIDEAYKNYMNNWPSKIPRIGPCLKEEFINKIKTDDEFSKTWDLKIEERALSERERIEMIQPFGMDALVPEVRKKWMEKNNVPTKLITITYNNETVEVYQ